jgi:hypothetical protein
MTANGETARKKASVRDYTLRKESLTRAIGSKANNMGKVKRGERMATFTKANTSLVGRMGSEKQCCQTNHATLGSS